MGCCGQHRNGGGVAPGWAPPSGQPAAPPSPAVAPGTGLVWPPSMGRQQAATLRLRYRDRARIAVRGPATGRSYEFSAAQPVQAVEVRDAQSLLRTGLFTRVDP